MSTERLQRLAEVMHVRSSAEPVRMLKADIRISDTSAREVVGRAIERTRTLAGLNLNEFADACQRDPSQVRRWIKGEERPHIDAIIGNSSLRPSFAQAVAELTGQDVEISIRIRRSA